MHKYLLAAALGLVLLIGGLFLRVNLIPIADFELLTLAEKITLQTEVGLAPKWGDSLNGQRISYFVVGFHFLLLALQTGAQKLFGRCGFTCALDNLRKDDFFPASKGMGRRDGHESL